MEQNSLYTVLVTLFTVLTSGAAWRFYEKRATSKEKSENFMKDECRERITKLEILLEKSAKEKDQMRDEILALTSLVSELKVKVEYLEKENNELTKNKRIIRNNKNF